LSACSGQIVKALDKCSQDLQSKEAALAESTQNLVLVSNGFLKVKAALERCRAAPLPDTEVASTLKRRVLDVERFLGERILDDNGEIIDLPSTICKMRKRVDKRFSGNRPAARRALISDFGIATGLAVFNAQCESA
jgi:hypothetical protein